MNHKKRNPQNTRQEILQAAFHMFFRQGYQGTSIQSILQQTGLTKGALFYHFQNKISLAYAVIDEIIEPIIVNIWLVPLDSRNDPVQALQDMLRHSIHGMRQYFDSKELLLGCPLNHFAEEMSSLDDGIQDRCNRIFRRWQSGIAGVLIDAKDKKQIASHIDEENIAMFIVASIQGAISMGKRSQTLAGYLEALQGNSEQLAHYLKSLQNT